MGKSWEVTRYHSAQNSVKAQKKVGKKNNMGLEGDGNTSYVLRENPKKSWKFSGSTQDALGQENVCKVCGKVFESLRALFGHMRHHSGKQRSEVLCKECGKNFGSQRALTTHMRIHSNRFKVCNEPSQRIEMDNQSNSETPGLVRRKRSNRMRYKVSPNSSFSSLNEIEQEVEEGAICLVMMSRGLVNCDGFNSLSEFLDNNSVSVEVKLSLDEGGTFACDGDYSFKMKKPRVGKSDSCVSDSKIVFANQKVCGFSESDSGIAVDEEEKVELDVTLDNFYKMPKNDNEIEKENHNEMKMRLTDVELDEDFMEDDGLDLAGSGSMNYSLSMKARFEICDAQLRGKSCNKNMFTTLDSGILSTNSRREAEFKCRTCNKSFHSYQSLGGHQTIHRTKNCSELKIVECEKNIRRNIFPDVEANCKLECSEILVEQEMSYELKESKEHKCPVCFKVFASGQALGGHKRAHSIKYSGTKAEETMAIKHEISDVCEVIDLNLPVILEEETVADVGFQSWWVENDHKHELLLDLIPN